METDNAYNHLHDTYRKELESKIREQVRAFRDDPEILSRYFKHPRFQWGIGDVLRRIEVMMNALWDDPQALAAIRCRYEDRHMKQ